MTKSATVSKKPRKQHSPEFRSEALKLAERIGVAAAARNSAFTSLSYIYGAANYSSRKRLPNGKMSWPLKMPA